MSQKIKTRVSSLPYITVDRETIEVFVVVCFFILLSVLIAVTNSAFQQILKLAFVSLGITYIFKYHAIKLYWYSFVFGVISLLGFVVFY